MSNRSSQIAPEENHLFGIAWMLLTMCLFVSMDSLAKLLTQDFPTLQVVWARFFFHIVWISLFVRKALISTFRSGNYKLQLLRSALLAATTVMFFSGLRTTELSTATSIMFLSPIYVTLLAIPMLGEKVGIRRFAGILIGFIGAVIIVHPRSDIGLLAADSLNQAVSTSAASANTGWLPEIGHLLIIAAAFSNAIYQIMTRKARTVDSSTTSLLYSAVVGAVVMSFWAPSVWQAPQASDWLLMTCLGLIGCASHFCLIRAFRNAPASLVVPFSYSSLLWSILAGYLIFSALPDVWTLTGASMIIISGLYIFYREQLKARAL